MLNHNKKRLSHEDRAFAQLSHQALFEKLGSLLPLVFSFERPIEVYSYETWLSNISRGDLISRSASSSIKDYFEELSLSDIKERFNEQLFAYYQDRVQKVLLDHNKILYSHYHPNHGLAIKGGKK